MVNVDQFNSGSVIPYVTSGISTASCRGTFSNSADTNHVEYYVNIDSVVTETFQSQIKRQERLPLTLWCKVVRDVNSNTPHKILRKLSIE